MEYQTFVNAKKIGKTKIELMKKKAMINEKIDSVL